MKHDLPESDEITGRHLDWQLFRRFLRLVLPYRGSALAALALLPLVAATKLVQPYLLMRAIDDAILPGDLERLGMLAGLFLLALSAEALVLFAQGYLVQMVGQRIMADLRREGFAHLLRLPSSFFDRHPSGRLVTRLTGDVENVGELFGAGVVLALGDLLTLVAIVAAMLWLDVSLSLTAFAMIPPLLLLLWLFRRAMRQAMRQVRARLAGLNAYVAERIAGIQEVRLFGQEQRTLGEFEKLQQGYAAGTFRVINWDALLYSLVEVLGALAIAAILWHGGAEVAAGAASFGTLVAFIEYVQKFFAPLRDLSAKYSVVQAGNASLERIFDLLDQRPEPGGAPLAAGGGGLRLEGVSFSYDGRTPVLEQIDLDLPPGRSLALVGATGSGKTTLSRLLLRFYQPTAGRILLAGVDLAGIDPKDVRRHIGWVAQEPFLFAGSLRENLDPARMLDDAQLSALLRDLGAGGVLQRLGGPAGVLVERGKNLSAGERQLLCLARALAADPPLLLLDEATSRLDGATEALVERALACAGAGRSVLLIAHRLRSARTADQIAVLRRGRVVERGTHGVLLARDGLYARLWRLQQLRFGEAEGQQTNQGGAE